MTDLQRQRAWDLLTERWRALRNGYAASSLSCIVAVVDFAFDMGFLTADERELWHRRIQTCPGHDDEGGRVWCAYCGDLPREVPE